MAERTLAITEAHRARLMRTLRRRVGPYWAEDLAQETLAAAWSNPRTPDHEPDLTRWLHAIARNLAASRLRADLPVSPLDPDVLPAAVDDWDGEEWSAALEAGMAALPAETRTAMTLRYLDGMSQAEVSSRLGVSEGALESRLQRGKRAIHRYLINEHEAVAVALGLVAPTGTWIPTNRWCDGCGRQRLEGMWLPGGGYRLDCPSCAVLGGARSHVTSVTAPIAAGLTRFGAAEQRLHRRIFPWANEGVLPQRCPFCDAPAAVVTETVPDHDFVQVALTCSACPHRFWMSPHGLASVTAAFVAWRAEQTRIEGLVWPVTIRRPADTRMLVRWRSRTDATVFEALVDPTLRQPIETCVANGRGVVLH